MDYADSVDLKDSDCGEVVIRKMCGGVIMRKMSSGVFMREMCGAVEYV